MEGERAPMTVNPNPKKSRPYDVPPKRRRSLIPGSPDSAAAGFFVAAAVWFVVATGIGALAIIARISPFEFSYAFGFFDLAFELDGRRIDYAFVNATVYGWLTNAGFAAVAFITPRLFGAPLAGERILNVALAIWNLALAGGIAALYVFELGPNAPLTAMPWFIDGGLATATLLVIGSFLATAGVNIRSGYISTWFAGIALLALGGLTALNASLGLLDFLIEIPAVTVALVSFFIDRALITMWLLGTALAILHYVVPRATGLPLASGGLAILTWLTWLALAPVAAIVELRDTQVPFVVTTIGSVATMLLLVPASLAVVNIVLSMRGRWSRVFSPGALALAAVAAAFLLAVALLDAVGAITSVRAIVANTEWEVGLFVWASYGTFSLAALAMAEHALPRIMRRAWGGGALQAATLWLTFGGAALTGLALFGAGLAQGSLVAAGTPPEDIALALLPYRVAALGAFGLVALAGLTQLANLFLMYTSGEPAEYTVPGQSAPAAAGH